MSFLRFTVLSCTLLVLALPTSVATGSAAGDGAVTPSFESGTLVVIGEGYRPGEQVEIIVRIAGVRYPFTAAADALGSFSLDTTLAAPPMSPVEIQALDEAGTVQVTTTNVPEIPFEP